MKFWARFLIASPLLIAAILGLTWLVVAANWVNPADDNDGLKLFMDFNDLNTENFNNTYNFTQDGNFSSTPDGKFGAGFNVTDGTGHMYIVNYSLAVNWSDFEAMTVEYWYRSSSRAIPQQRQHFVAGSRTAYVTSYQTGTPDRIFVQSTLKGGGNFGSRGIGLDQWIHIAVVWVNNSDLLLYLNGSLVSNVSGGAGEQENWVREPFKIGGATTTNVARSGNYSFDSFLVWNTARTGAEILSDMGGANESDSSLSFNNIFPANDTFFLTGLNINLSVSVTPIGGDLSNATLDIYDSSGTRLFRLEQNITGNIVNNTNFTVNLSSVDNFHWNVLVCLDDNTCNLASDSNRTFNVAFDEASQTFNATTYETAQETYTINVTIDTNNFPTVTATLLNNGSEITGATSDSGVSRIYTSGLQDIPLVNSTRNLQWQFTIANSSTTFFINSSIQTFDIAATNLTLGQVGTTPVPFINFTFSNETTGNEQVTASIPRSSFEYWLGSGNVRKTLSFTSATENKNYTLTFAPADRKVFINISIDYTNTASQQRTFTNGSQIHSNTTRNITLPLLPTGEGIFVTFQVINAALQPLEGALVTLERSGFGIVSQTETGASGTTNVFLNPNSLYTLTVSQTGFSTFSATQTFPTSEFTVTLGTAIGTVEDLLRGITFQIRPKVQVLANQTDYQFNMTLTSTFNTVELWGYHVINKSGFELGFNTSTNNGGFLSSTINTENNSLITMNYFWRINGSYVNSSQSWGVHSPADGSISGFFRRLTTYLNAGIFGIDKFTVAIIIFLFIFVSVGILSFKFGLRSPETLMLVTVFIIGLFDIGLGLIPSPFPGSLPGFATFTALLVAVAIWLGRNR